MRTVVFSLALLCNASLANARFAIEEIRKNYEAAVGNKNLCQQMIKHLEKHRPTQVHLAYLGAFQMIWASHIINPVTKLSTFNKGRNNMSDAIRQTPENVEIIFLRYSIQKNSPDFLGYKHNLKDDKSFLINKLKYITSSTLKNMVERVLNK